MQQFPKDTPINITCGNSGPKPGVVYAHATSGAISQYGRMVALNVGTWPDTGADPKMTEQTAKNLIDWCYAAVTAVALRGRRVLVFGHDSMGMETALAHILPTRNVFGIEITRLDMKLLADMLSKKAYNEKELCKLRGWIDRYLGKRLELTDAAEQRARFLQDNEKRKIAGKQATPGDELLRAALQNGLPVSSTSRPPSIFAPPLVR